MNFYISRLTQEELIALINSFIKSADERRWDGKRPAIEGDINYVVPTAGENNKTMLQVKRIVGQYVVFDIGTFAVDDYTATLLVWGGKYLSFDRELHEYLAVRFGSAYVEDYYEYEQQQIVKENIRLMLLTGDTRK